MTDPHPEPTLSGAECAALADEANGVDREPPVLDPSNVHVEIIHADGRPPTTVIPTAVIDQPGESPIAVEPTAETAHTPDLERGRLLELENARLKDEMVALKKDKAESVDLAEEAEDARRDWEDLKGRAKTAKDRYEACLGALSKKVRGEVQVEMGAGDDDDEEGEQASIPFHGEKQAPALAAPAETTPAPFGDGGPANSDAIATRLSAGDVMVINGLDWAQVSRAALSELVSTGKPATVRPLVMSSGAYVLTDVVDRRAVLHPLHDAETFVNKYRVEGMKLPNEERPAELVALGSHCGIPVKVKSTEKGKRAKLAHIGSDADALILEVPENAAISATPPAEDVEAVVEQTIAKIDEVLAGPGSDIVGNRILAQLDAASTAYLTIDALAKILGVDEMVIRNAAKSDSRLVYERTDDDELITKGQA